MNPEALLSLIADLYSQVAALTQRNRELEAAARGEGQFDPPPSPRP